MCPFIWCHFSSCRAMPRCAVFQVTRATRSASRASRHAFSRAAAGRPLICDSTHVCKPDQTEPRFHKSPHLQISVNFFSSCFSLNLWGSQPHLPEKFQLRVFLTASSCLLFPDGGLAISYRRWTSIIFPILMLRSARLWTTQRRKIRRYQGLYVCLMTN